MTMKTMNSMMKSLMTILMMAIFIQMWLLSYFFKDDRSQNLIFTMGWLLLMSQLKADFYFSQFGFATLGVGICFWWLSSILEMNLRLIP